MLPDHYEYLVQKSKQQELIERTRQRLGGTAAVHRKRLELLAPLRRVLCRLDVVVLHTGSCPLPAQSPR